MRPKLTLKPRVDPATKPKLDPAKVSLSEELKARYVDRGGRYIFQLLVVTYATPVEMLEKFHMSASYYPPEAIPEISRTWVDVPLVPEVYVG